LGGGQSGKLARGSGGVKHKLWRLR